MPSSDHASEPTGPSRIPRSQEPISQGERGAADALAATQLLHLALVAGSFALFVAPGAPAQG